MREGEYIFCKVGRRSPKNKNCEGRRCHHHHWAQWYQIFIENLFHSLFFSSFSSSSSLRQSTLMSLINAFSFRNSKILRAFFLILYFNFHPVTRFLCREKNAKDYPLETARCSAVI